jgi:hypothetical protein
MPDTLRQPEPPAREGSGWVVFEHLAAADLSDALAVQQMTDEQRMVFGINMLRQEVNSGGFDRYFRYSGGNTALDAAQGAKVLGPGWSTLVDEARRAIGSPYPIDTDSRAIAVDILLEDQPELFESFDERLYQIELDDPADERIDAFIWSNKSAFFV